MELSEIDVRRPSLSRGSAEGPARVCAPCSMSQALEGVPPPLPSAMSALSSSPRVTALSTSSSCALSFAGLHAGQGLAQQAAFLASVRLMHEPS